MGKSPSARLFRSAWESADNQGGDGDFFSIALVFDLIERNVFRPSAAKHTSRADGRKVKTQHGVFAGQAFFSLQGGFAQFDGTGGRAAVRTIRAGRIRVRKPLQSGNGVVHDASIDSRGPSESRHPI